MDEDAMDTTEEMETNVVGKPRPPPAHQNAAPNGAYAMQECECTVVCTMLLACKPALPDAPFRGASGI